MPDETPGVSGSVRGCPSCGTTYSVADDLGLPLLLDVMRP
jgi:hypothetical protein